MNIFAVRIAHLIAKARRHASTTLRYFNHNEVIAVLLDAREMSEVVLRQSESLYGRYSEQYAQAHVRYVRILRAMSEVGILVRAKEEVMVNDPR